MCWPWRFLVIGYYALVVSGAMRFHLWSQVVTLWTDGASPWIIFESVHGLRYLLVYWIFWLSDTLSLSANFAFSLVVATVMLITARLIVNTVQMVEAMPPKNYWLLSALVGSTLVGISAFMNGRMSFAILGMSVLVYALISREAGKFDVPKMLGLLFAAFFLCSVSTGAFLVGVIFLVTWFASMLFHGVWRHPLQKQDIMTGACVLILLALPSVVYLNKNIGFFGGGVYGVVMMLQHGAGAIFTRFNALSQFLLQAGLMIGIPALSIAIKIHRMRPVVFAVLAATIGGLFGYSSAATGIAPALILGIVVYRRVARDSLPKSLSTQSF